VLLNFFVNLQESLKNFTGLINEFRQPSVGCVETYMKGSEVWWLSPVSPLTAGSGSSGAIFAGALLSSPCVLQKKIAGFRSVDDIIM
jgi:hypothetical protein